MRISLFLCLALFTAACTGKDPEPAASTLKAGPDAPKFVRLSWAADPSASAAVVWHTDVEVSGAAVEYGATAAHGKSAAARNFEIKGIDGFFHEAFLTGLAAQSTVHYRVGSRTGVSEDFTFQTAPKADADVPFSFALQGDSRSDSFGVGDGYSLLVERMKKEVPAFILDSGDYTTTSLPDEWVLWLKAGDAIGATIPRLTTFGNHEIVANTYFSLMALPKDADTKEEDQEKWYSVDYGPVHIVCLYTGFGDLKAATKVWLEKDLAASQAKWKVAFMHMPPYNAGHHGDSETRMKIREQWVPLFEKYGVDLVVGGHDHNFQNFGFLKNDAPVAAGEGPLYLVSGGAGAPLYDTDSTVPDLALLKDFGKFENYVLVSVDGDTMTVQPKRLDGTPAISPIVITK